MDDAAAVAAKPRVTVAQCRLLAHLWPYAQQYDKPGYRSEIVADIFDGWKTQPEVQPLVDGGLVYPVHIYDPHDEPKHYHSWNLTPLGERAVFGLAVRRELERKDRDQ